MSNYGLKSFLMKKYSITDAGVLSTQNGNRVAYLNVAGVNGRIFRSLDQIKTDLMNSGLLNGAVAHTIVSVDDQRIAGVLPDLIGGTVRGDITHRKAGEEYTVEETSGVMQPTHPDFGKYAVGDIAKVTTDHTRVDGFLALRRDPDVELTVRTARERANLMAELAGLFGGATSGDASDGNAVAESEEVVPEDIALEAGLPASGEEAKASE